MTESFTHRALDPARSVVVEACAGSGKTWLLVSRMLRILLDGARPGDILAITYTRKAAREIEARLRQWLRELALADDAEACEFLAARGVDADAAPGLLARARRLIETVEQASPGVTITTFHGWFGRILAGASLTSGLAGFTLAEAEQPLLDEAWTIFARHCAQAPDSAEARALTELFEIFGLANTRAMLGAFVSRRAEWQVFRGEASLDEMIERLGDDLGATTDDAALGAFFGGPVVAQCERYADFLARNTNTDRSTAERLRSVLLIDDPAACFDALMPVFITGGGTPRIRKPSAAQAKRLTSSGEADFLALHAELCERVQRCVDARDEVRILAFNAAALRAGTALLDSFDSFKRSRRLFDYADLEVQVDRLLCDEGQAPYLQARLDARYRHVLLDEFQDTNPLQWRILLAWLSAYDADAWRPSIFMVGDPKQSIYRFRRADARIFDHAANWLGEHFGAARLPNNHTWRNAPAVVEVVNEVFSNAPAFTGFEAQHAHKTDLAGQVMLLPLVEPPASAAGGDDEYDEDDERGLRDPLSAARLVKENIARRIEAQQMVETLADWVGRVGVNDEGAQRPLRWGDVLILTRTRRILPEYERALREAGVPYASVSRGQLLTTLEAADLVALLTFLTTPSDDLALVHTLRTPVFELPDDTLIVLAARDEDHWWARLQGLSDSADAHGAAAARAVAALARWVALAAQLPVHDLLDRIYHEADVMAAYRRRVPPPMWPGVRANLEAFLALALGVDGGRFPSLPRFVAELARLERASDEEAPDEGALIDEGGDGRVRIMTIHGAKGLEAPVVWLIDANNAHQRPDNFQPLIDWPVGAAVPAHFSLHASGKLKGRARDAVFDAEAAAAEREALNLLYVAITRAAQAFVASGSVSRADGESCYTRLQQALETLSDGASHGVLPDSDATEIPEVPVPDAVPTPVPAPVGERLASDESSAAKAFGIAMHALIEARTTLGAREPRALPDAVKRAAAAIVDAPDMQRFFDRACFEAAYNEVEIVHADGRLGRIDRLVVFADAVWVLDYKSGSSDAETLERYHLQMEGYRAALAGVFDTRPVHAMLVFADGTRHSL